MIGMFSKALDRHGDHTVSWHARNSDIASDRAQVHAGSLLARASPRCWERGFLKNCRVFLLCVASRLPAIPPATMSFTPNAPLLARSQQLDSPPEYPRSERNLETRARLLRLLRPGSTQTIGTSPDEALAVAFSDAFINDPAPTAERHAQASRSYSYRETRSTASAHPGTRGETRIASTSPSCRNRQSSPSAFGWRAHLTADPNIDRVGRVEVLNDVTSRALRVFRKSPCPPRSSRSTLPSE